MMGRVRFTGDWKDLNEIVLYGLGLVAEQCIDKLLHDFSVPYIIDQKKAGTVYKGIPVVRYQDAAAKIKNEKKKIIVLTSQKAYAEIKDILMEDGMVEYRDFCGIEPFAVGWYWDNRRQINIYQVHTAVTTYCTLNCRKCNMFMPYFKERQHYSYEELKADMDLFMENIDYIFLYVFLGGEPFLNPELHKIIEYAAKTYPDKIGKLSITTNATILPDEVTLEILSKYHVQVVISDYTSAVAYQDKLDKFIDVMDKGKIRYIINEALEWKDFGFPDRLFDWGEDYGKLKCHRIKCSPVFHGINDGKFYYCHIIWSAEKAGIFRNAKEDYIELDKLDAKKLEDRKRLSEFSIGNWNKGYLELCRLCGGCGEDNRHLVSAGGQVAGNGYEA